MRMYQVLVNGVGPYDKPYMHKTREAAEAEAASQRDVSGLQKTVSFYVDPPTVIIREIEIPDTGSLGAWGSVANNNIIDALCTGSTLSVNTLQCASRNMLDLFKRECKDWQL